VAAFEAKQGVQNRAAAAPAPALAARKGMIFLLIEYYFSHFVCRQAVHQWSLQQRCRLRLGMLCRQYW
jgi:hypothetical protein